MMPPIDDARYEFIDSYKELRESLEENLNRYIYLFNIYLQNNIQVVKHVSTNIL
jgi:hypothetical protein